MRSRKPRPAPDEVRAWTELEHNVRVYRFVQVSVGRLLRWMLRAKGIGIRTIPKRGPVIIVPNHVSNIDPVVVVTAMHRPVFHLAKHTLFNTRARSWFFQKVGGQIPVNRSAKGGNEAAIQAAVAALAKGACLAIYPEGHRSPDGIIREAKPGVGRIALLSGAPCYPLAIEGTMRVWPKGQKLPKLFVPSRVRVGKPRQYAKDPARAADRDACQRIADEIMGDVAAMLGQRYEPGGGAPPDESAPSPGSV